MLETASDWLASTALSGLFRDVAWIVPLAQTIHILAIAIVLSSVGMFELRLMGLAGRRVSIAAMAQRFIPWIWGAIAVLALSGSILIVAEPSRSLLNPVFQTKMCLLAVAVLVTWLVQRSIHADAEFWDESPSHRRAARFTGLISLVLWISIAVCGRLIAYVGQST
jgi:hypothetical protein